MPSLFPSCPLETGLDVFYPREHVARLGSDGEQEEASRVY